MKKTTKFTSRSPFYPFKESLVPKPKHTHTKKHKTKTFNSKSLHIQCLQCLKDLYFSKSLKINVKSLKNIYKN